MSTLERVCESVLGSDGAQIRHVEGGSRGLKRQFRCLSGFRDAVTGYLTKKTYNLYLGWLEKQTRSFHQISNPKLMDDTNQYTTGEPDLFHRSSFSGLIYWHNSLV